MGSTIRSIDLTCDPQERESLLATINAVAPSWEYFALQKMTGGVNNTLFKLTKKESESDERDDGEALLIRIYGGSSGFLVDRKWELDCHEILFEHGLAPHIIGRFNNGYAYGFVPGKVCSPTDLALEPVWRGIARRMAQWHATLPLEYPPKRNMWKVLDKWVVELPFSTEAEKIRAGELFLEGGLMQSMFCKTYVDGMPELVFTHCDLLAGNIVIRSNDGQGEIIPPADHVEEVDFIDFEYAMAAPAAFDIASHFSEWAGFECDYTLLPSRSLRRRFLTEYTSTYNSLRKPEAGTIELDQMCTEVDKFRGVPGYVWGLAALIQSRVSKNDEFDFKAYADLRIQEYLDYKAEKFGTREAEGKELPLRERCWAREH